MDLNRFQEFFLASLGAVPKGALAERLDLATEAEISYYMDLCPLQDSLRFRARYYGLRIANWLIDEAGELDKGRLSELNRQLEEGFFLIGPRREADALIFAHLQISLSRLAEERDYEIWLKKFSLPLCHKKAEAVIRETLWPESIRTVQTFHIRRAVLAAWFTLLRQTTGSCFATAPAILIQQNEPLRLFRDLYELLTTGRLKTVIAGKEYMVPMSISSGLADLQKPLSGIASLENLAVSPGLIRAFEAGGVIESDLPFTEKIRKMLALFHDREMPSTPEKLIHTVLLEQCALTEEDLEDEAYLSHIQMTPLLARQSAVYYQKPSERAQKVADWKKRFGQACTAFQTFTDCSLLRTWEYTIASFCDVKIDFARWNLYIGLGFNSDQPGGIGSFLHRTLQDRLDQANQEASKMQEEYERAVASARATEAMLSNASEAQRGQLRGELVAYVHAANATLEMRDKAVAKAQAIAEFFSSLLKQYDEKLQEYFQELFDPSLFGEEAHLYDDSLAGFRLVYKHGRADASQWTAIHSSDEYIDSLRDFFSSVERDIALPQQLDPSFLSEITTALIQFIQEQEFLASALERSKKHGRRSPWDYFSGGTMETLLQAYCGREKPFTEEQIVPRSEEQLLDFLLKVKDSRATPLLMRSPTHAFIFYPTLLPAQSGSLLEMNRKELRKAPFDEEMQEHLAHRLSDRLPALEKPLFLHLFRQRDSARNLAQFRLQLIDSLSSIKDSRIKNRAALVDSLLYESTPLLKFQDAKKGITEIVDQICARFSIPVHHFAPSLERLEGTYMGPYEIHQSALSSVLETFRNPVSPIDWDIEIAATMRRLGLCYPYPLLFADTNWSGWFFGWILNPATGQLELWRLNRTALQGFPMSDWKEWLNENNTSPWVVLTQTQEYAASLG